MADLRPMTDTQAGLLPSDCKLPHNCGAPYCQCRPSPPVSAEVDLRRLFDQTGATYSFLNEQRVMTFEQFKAAVQASGAAAQVPEGWALVPKEPTDEMIDAMVNAQIEAEKTFDDLTGPMEAAYAAGIAAAPKG